MDKQKKRRVRRAAVEQAIDALNELIDIGMCTALDEASSGDRPCIGIAFVEDKICQNCECYKKCKDLYNDRDILNEQIEIANIKEQLHTITQRQSCN